MTAGMGDMSAYRVSYENDAAWAGRLAQMSGAHGRSGDATRAHAIVNDLFTSEAMGGAILVAAEQEEAGIARRLALSLTACGFRAQFVAAGEAAVWPHGWAYSVRSSDAIICISHAGHAGSGSLAEAIGAVRTVHETVDDKTARLPLSGGHTYGLPADGIAESRPSVENHSASKQENEEVLEGECVRTQLMDWFTAPCWIPKLTLSCILCLVELTLPIGC